MTQRDPIRQLVDDARDGDHAAFEALVEHFQKRVLRFVASRARWQFRSSLEVDDIVQETFVRALESLPRFRWDGEDALFQWLCGIAKNVLLRSAEKARRTANLDDGPDALSASSPSPSRVMRREERLARLEKSIQALPENLRMVVYLARFEGLKVKEIAERLGKSPNAVSHLLARALTELRTRFGDTESLRLPDREIPRPGGDDDE